MLRREPHRANERTTMRIEQLMSQPAVICRPTDTLNTPARLMWDYDCGFIPVIAEDDRIVGVITDRDICMAAYLRGQPLHEIPVSVVMAKQVVACFPKEFIDAAERVMGKAQVRRVPVLDELNRPMGVLAFSDMIRHAASTHSRDGLDRTLILTLATICEPRPRPPQLVKMAEDPLPTRIA
jgi:CBS domain-containing protein